MTNQNQDSFKEKYKKHREKYDQTTSKIGIYLQDLVYGGNDGIVTTFAVVSGSIGANLDPKVIIILGLANLIGDGTSMGFGNYLGIKSELDHYQKELKREYREIEEEPDCETEEIREIYRRKGFTGNILEEITKVITSDKDRWVDTMMKEELELTIDPNAKPWAHGLTTFFSFLFFGFIPLIPFVFGLFEKKQFLVSIIGAFIALLTLGILRYLVTRERGIIGVLEIIFVGSICAAVAYGVGALLDRLI
ncbi:VIT1/CCC1 transporter family protein [Candidatus Gracilibacteria bacterium]|jgi:VIT1/CCC1 family predicted Fe2+/Mn2+ transporter|nr:VIT1/CCC1 transporter family protein [Candidatus Gracilibacteria bacterium]